jgi:anti-sigma-K factor RskA
MENFENPQQWQELLADYVLGDVTSEEAETVYQLLITHPELQEELVHLQETLALIPLTLPESSPPKKLKANILQLAQIGADTTSMNAIVDSLQKKFRLNLLVLGTIAFSLVVGLGFYNYRLQKQLAIAQSELSQTQTKITAQSESNHRLVSLKGTTKAPNATGMVVILPENNQVIMTVNNLTPLPSGKVYRLWAVSDGKNFDCGKFNVNEKGQIMKQMPLDDIMKNNPKLLITIEPTKTVPKPTGAEVMTSQI